MILARLFGPCIFGHAADFLARRVGGRMMKECPRCHAAYAEVLGGEVVKDGAAHRQEPCAGVPTGRAVLVGEPKRKVARFR